jgi:Tfp pilus assembly protein PilF
MLWWLIPLVVSGVCLLVILWTLWRKIPQLRMIDVAAIPSERDKQMKDRLLAERVKRLQAEKFGAVGKAAFAAARAVSRLGRRAVQKLYALEQYYQKVRQTPEELERAKDPEVIKKMIAEAEEFVRQQEFIPAEKLYIQVISHNPKNVEAYEGLGNLYLKNEQYDQARETLLFTLRLSPDDASVNMSLAELERQLDNPAAAVAFVRHSVDKRPGNPKYLDLYIESALLAKNVSEAERGLELLRTVNPENQKLQEFAEEIGKLKGMPSQT